MTKEFKADSPSGRWPAALTTEEREEWTCLRREVWTCDGAAWANDISWLCLVVILDLCSRLAVG